jgi:hypothetical protein
MTGPKQMSEKQIAANRANAQRSTGPRTAQGKGVSRWNATRHGILSRSVIPEPLAQFESRADFDELLAGLVAEFAPASTLEEMLVERIAVSWWRMARVARAEAGFIASRQQQVKVDVPSEAALRDFSRPAGARADDPVSQYVALRDAMRTKRSLRAYMVAHDPGLREATDDAIDQAAEALSAELAAKVRRQAELDLEIGRAARSLPELFVIGPLARYEAAAERQLYTALNALERIKRLRHGDSVPAPDPVSPDDLRAEADA